MGRLSSRVGITITHRRVPEPIWVDELTDIIRYGRVGGRLATDLCRLASECSYSRSTGDRLRWAVSRQTVMQTLRKLQIPEVATDKIKNDVPEIHIQADEDTSRYRRNRPDERNRREWSNWLFYMTRLNSKAIVGTFPRSTRCRDAKRAMSVTGSVF